MLQMISKYHENHCFFILLSLFNSCVLEWKWQTMTGQIDLILCRCVLSLIARTNQDVYVQNV